MQTKFLHIKWYLVLLTIAQAYVEASNYNQLLGDNRFRSAMQKILDNQEHYKEIFAQRRQENAKFFEILKKADENYPKLKQIKNAIAKIVKQVKENVPILETAKNSLSSEPALTDEQVIDALLSVLEKAVFFVDLYFHFPEMIAQILKSENKWNVLLSGSLSYTITWAFLLDQSTIRKIAVLEEQLRQPKIEDINKKTTTSRFKDNLKRINMEF